MRLKFLVSVKSSANFFFVSAASSIAHSTDLKLKNSGTPKKCSMKVAYS